MSDWPLAWRFLKPIGSSEQQNAEYTVVQLNLIVGSILSNWLKSPCRGSLNFNSCPEHNCYNIEAKTLILFRHHATVWTENKCNLSELNHWQPNVSYKHCSKQRLLKQYEASLSCHIYQIYMADFLPVRYQLYIQNSSEILQQIIWSDLTLVDQPVSLVFDWYQRTAQHAVSKLPILGFICRTKLSFHGSKDCDNTINDGVLTLTALTCLGHFALSWRGQSQRTAESRGYKWTEVCAGLNEITVHGICQGTSRHSPCGEAGQE